MQGLEKKVLTYKENLLRITELRAEMIDAEISLNFIKKELGLNNHELNKLIAGELQEKEAKVKELIKKAPKAILGRNKELKTFQKILLRKNIKMKDIEQALNVNRNKIYRMIRGEALNRDRELEAELEKYLDEKLFC